ncbi:MAG: lipopolysaccharide biosynthesis protein [Patescibacteria group bacterium]
MGYTKTAAKGLTWIGAIRGLTRSLSFVRIAILARILSPDQMGHFAIATMVLAFLEIVTETGINVFLIQEGKKLEDYVDTAWSVSILRGLLICLVVLVASWPISQFFSSPDALILVQLAAAIPLIRGLINPSIIRLQKDLTFDREFYLRTGILLADAAVSIAISFIYRTPAGLVWGMIAGAILEVILSHLLISPRPQWNLDFSKVNQILNRGRWMTAAGVFNYFFHNGDNIVVGRILSTAKLGVYQLAYSISILPITEIADTFGRVMFPVYSRVASDRARLFRAFTRVTAGITLLVTPFCLLLIFFPENLISFFLGDKWLEAATVLPILALFGGIRAITGSTSSLFLAVKKQEYVTAVTLASLAGLAVTIVPAVSRYGILGASYSALIGSIAAIPVIVYFLSKTFSR